MVKVSQRYWRWWNQVTVWPTWRTAEETFPCTHHLAFLLRKPTQIELTPLMSTKCCTQTVLQLTRTRRCWVLFANVVLSMPLRVKTRLRTWLERLTTSRHRRCDLARKQQSLLCTACLPLSIRRQTRRLRHFPTLKEPWEPSAPEQKSMGQRRRTDLPQRIVTGAREWPTVETMCEWKWVQSHAASAWSERGTTRRRNAKIKSLKKTTRENTK